MQKAITHNKLRRNETTTGRCGTKMSTTFCVFLLTGISHPLILHIQIRGTWKRHTDRVGDSKVRVIPQSGPGFKRKKIEREVPAPRPYLAEHLL